MGRIIGYQYDDNVQDGDAWIGSEDGGGRTKQYTAEAVANYLNIQGKISIVGQMTYKYGVTPLSGPGTFAVFGGGTDPVAFSAITKLTLSNTDVSKQRVVEFLNLLVGSDILISKQGAISTFGYYSIDSYAVNAADPAYYDLGVTFKSGNGSMEAEQIYETQNFTLAAEENISTLQTTIDAGNTYASGTSLWQWDPGKISQVDPDEGWGLALSPEEGVIFTDGVGNVAGRSHLQATNLSIGNLTYTGSVFADNLTANRNFQLPNNSGTLALTTDITTSPWDTVTGGINYANGNVGIGTTTPSAKLDVNGDALINGLTVGQGAGTSDFGNTVFGKTALDSITTGRRNVAIGNEALLDNTVGNYNIALGYRSLENNSASNNVAIGVEALQRVETAGNNTAVGRYALGLTSGAGNTAIGYAAGYLRVGGTNGGSINSVFIGSLTTSNGFNPENEIVIGTGAVSAGSNTVVLGNDDIVSTRLKGDVIVANGNVGIGTTSPSDLLTVSGNARVTGVLKLASGSAQAPSLAHRADENTGLFFPANDTIGFTTSNTEKMRITSAGNVGIGTTSPGTKLYVDGGESTFNRGNSAGTIATFRGQNAVKAVIGTATSYFTGNLGIGTTSPNQKLHVSGGKIEVDVTSSVGTELILKNLAVDQFAADKNYHEINFITSSTSSETTGGYVRIKAGQEVSGNDNRSYLGFWTAPDDGAVSEKMRIASSGNVGIGTTSPSEKLEVNGRIKVQTSAGSLTFKELGAGSATIAGSATVGIEAAGNFRVKTNVTNEAFTVLSTGNVGIGTTSPQNLLHLGDNTNSKAGTIRIDSFVANQFWKIEPGTNTLNIKDYDGTSLVSFDGANNYALFNGGNVGIGTTSPTSKLEVAGGDIELSDVAGGITMISPDGTRYRITVANGGTLTVTAV